jgi:beta-N-acetylhexosaminidase
MTKFILSLVFVLVYTTHFFAQTTPAQRWADSVFNTLNNDQRIAQLMVVRMSAPGANGKSQIFDAQVKDLIKRYNIGSLCVFQGAPTQIATHLNEYQQMAQTPIMVCVDGEWGLAMRLDSVLPFPFQLSAGAVKDKNLLYQMGKAMGEQCKRMGIQVNYAPVVDINNNPANPVIGYRSFGEDKNKVGEFGAAITQGMQDAGIMACAKHFPGHGDVNVDSHYDLPVINKTIDQLTDLELYPFQQIFKANVGSVMIAHLYIPSIDNTPNRATSLSPNNVTNLLRNKMGYKGISFTDALEMKGVAKFFPGGEAAVQSLIAGNDMLCLPSDIPNTIEEIKKAIKKKRLSWNDIYTKTKKVLEAKYELGLHQKPVIELANLTADLNKKVNEVRYQVFSQAITSLRSETDAAAFLPIEKTVNEKIAYVAIGISKDNELTTKLRKSLGVDVFFFDHKQNASRVLSTIDLLKKRYKKVIMGLHNYNKRPASNFMMGTGSLQLIDKATAQLPNLTFIAFGNPYALKYVNEGKNVLPICAYEDDAIVHNIIYDVLTGYADMNGSLPVTVKATMPFGTGYVVSKKKSLVMLWMQQVEYRLWLYKEWMLLQQKQLIATLRQV